MNPASLTKFCKVKTEDTTYVNYMSKQPGRWENFVHVWVLMNFMDAWMFVFQNESLSTFYDRAVKWHPCRDSRTC